MIKKNMMIAAMALAMSVGIGSCSSAEEPGGGSVGNNGSVAGAVEIMPAERKFAMDLLDKVMEVSCEDENVVVSPLSLSLAVSMTANGAQGNTLQEILNTIYGPGMSLEEMNRRCKTTVASLANRDDVGISLANSLWIDKTYTVFDDFISKTGDVFSAEVRIVEDLTSDDSRIALNSWVSDATGGKIAGILEGNIERRTAALVNALYLCGRWAQPFDKDMTEEGSFTTSAGKTVKTSMMRDRNSRRFVDGGSYRSVILPLRGDLEMEIVLPSEKISPRTILHMLASGDPRTAEECIVDLSLPRFSAEYGNSDMVDIVKALGIKDACDGARSSYGLLSPANFMIEKIIQKSRVSVDENGVEAASATVLRGCLSPGSEDKVVRLTVDRPFLFIIRCTQTGSILFNGIINSL